MGGNCPATVTRMTGSLIPSAWALGRLTSLILASGVGAAALALSADFALPVLLVAQGVCCIWLLVVGLSSHADTRFESWRIPVFLLSRLQIIGALASVFTVVGQNQSQRWLAGIGGLLVEDSPRFALLFFLPYLVLLAHSARISILLTQASARYLLNDMPCLQMSIDGEMICGQLSAPDARRRRKLIERDIDFFTEVSRYSTLLEVLPFLCVILAGVSFVGGVASMSAYSGASLTFCCDQLLLGVLGQTTVGVVGTVVLTGILGLMTAGRRHCPECPGLPQKIAVVRALRGLVIELIGLLGLGLPPGTSLWVGLVWRERPRGIDTVSEKQVGSRPTFCRALPLVLEIGPGYRKLGRGWDAFRTEVSKASREVSSRLGCFLPRPEIRQMASLPEYSYRLLLAGRVVAQGQLWPTRVLVVGPESSMSHLQGDPAAEPLTGQLALWCEPDDTLEQKASGCFYYQPLAVLTLEAQEIMHRYAGHIVRDVDLEQVLDGLAPPELGDQELLLEVCRLLLDEGIPLHDRATIAHTFQEARQVTGEPRLLTELIRVALGGAICQPLLDPTGQLNVVRVLALAASERSMAGRAELLSRLAARVAVIRAVGLPEVIVTEGDDRIFVTELMRECFPHLRVLSWNEVPDKLAVQVLAEVGGAPETSSFTE